MSAPSRLPFFKGYVRLSLPRRWVADVVHFGLKSQVMGGTRVLSVGPLMAARRGRRPLIAWGALFLKALGILARKWPELRRCYLPYPWPHLYEHPHAVATVVVEREYEGESAVFCDQVQDPAEKSLIEIDRSLRALKSTPIALVGGYRRLIRVARIPRPLRRMLWRVGLYWLGPMRSRYFGTFSINSIPARRTGINQSTTPLTFSIFYGVPEPNGDLPLQVYFDHRVIDGMGIHRLLADLQAVLNREIVAELEALDPSAAGSAEGETAQ